MGIQVLVRQWIILAMCPVSQVCEMAGKLVRRATEHLSSATGICSCLLGDRRGVLTVSRTACVRARARPALGMPSGCACSYSWRAPSVNQFWTDEAMCPWPFRIVLNASLLFMKCAPFLPLKVPKYDFWIDGNNLVPFKISGFHGSDYEGWRLLGCYAVWFL
jgi:hypothetical protein